MVRPQLAWSSVGGRWVWLEFLGSLGASGIDQRRGNRGRADPRRKACLDQRRVATRVVLISIGHMLPSTLVCLSPKASRCGREVANAIASDHSLLSFSSPG